MDLFEFFFIFRLLQDHVFSGLNLWNNLHIYFIKRILIILPSAYGTFTIIKEFKLRTQHNGKNPGSE